VAAAGSGAAAKENKQPAAAKAAVEAGAEPAAKKAKQAEEGAVARAEAEA
jgi:hypothetical protein